MLGLKSIKNKIVVFEEEIKKINKIDHISFRKIFFVMLVYSKVLDSNLLDWNLLNYIIEEAQIDYSEFEIEDIKEPIRTKRQKRNYILECLCLTDLGEFYEITNKSFLLKYIEEKHHSKIAFEISDFEDYNIIYYYLNYMGGNWVKCKNCGKYFKGQKEQKNCFVCQTTLDLNENKWQKRNIAQKDKYGIVYKIKNKINNKVYIGITSQKNGFIDRYNYKGKGIERVYKYHLYRKQNQQKYNNHLLASIEKYGEKSFEVEEEFDVATNKEELEEKEIFWIKYFNSDNPLFGYNNTTGGLGRRSNPFNLFLSRKKKAPQINKKYDTITQEMKENKINKRLWKNSHYKLSSKEKELIERKIRFIQENRKRNPTKYCELCGLEYYRKNDKDNLCDYCRELSKEEIKEIKIFLKQQ